MNQVSNSLDQVARELYSRKRIICITGAGISVSAGIPDFRSSEGLYRAIKDKHSSHVVKGADLFDASLFRSQETTRIFYKFISGLKSLVLEARATDTHLFIHHLNTRKQLLRCYTQNIDCLEKPLNIPLVQLHGDLDTCICTLCSSTCEFNPEIMAAFDKGDTLPCPTCEIKNTARILGGKRQISVGHLRPNIVLYNEHHKQGDEIAETQDRDLNKRPDCLIVMGTSLKIVGVKRLIKDFAETVKENGGTVVMINKTGISKEMMNNFHYFIQESCDDAVAKIQKVWTELDEERDLKKKKLAEKKKKRAEKEEREMKGARPITTMFKQKKSIFIDLDDQAKVEKLGPVDNVQKERKAGKEVCVEIDVEQSRKYLDKMKANPVEKNTPSKQVEAKVSLKTRKVVVAKSQLLELTKENRQIKV